MPSPLTRSLPSPSTRSWMHTVMLNRGGDMEWRRLVDFGLQLGGLLDPTTPLHDVGVSNSWAAQSIACSWDFEANAFTYFKRMKEKGVVLQYVEILKYSENVFGMELEVGGVVELQVGKEQQLL
ncbi:hypothetical protein Tco_0267971 [Tanacetum coccineum]